MTESRQTPELKYASQTIESERFVLSACFDDHRKGADVFTNLTGLDFMDHRHRMIYGALNELHSDDSKITAQTVEARLEQKDLFVERAYLVGLDIVLPGIECLPLHVQIVQFDAERRRLVAKAEEGAGVTLMTSPLSTSSHVDSVSLTEAGRFRLSSGDVLWMAVPANLWPSFDAARARSEYAGYLPEGVRVQFVPAGFEPIAVHRNETTVAEKELDEEARAAIGIRSGEPPGGPRPDFWIEKEDPAGILLMTLHRDDDSTRRSAVPLIRMLLASYYDPWSEDARELHRLTTPHPARSKFRAVEPAEGS